MEELGLRFEVIGKRIGDTLKDPTYPNNGSGSAKNMSSAGHIGMLINQGAK
jgi:hypothetical protein